MQPSLFSCVCNLPPVLIYIERDGMRCIGCHRLKDFDPPLRLKFKSNLTLSPPIFLMASRTRRRLLPPEAADEPRTNRQKLSPPTTKLRVHLNPADCDLDFNIEGNGLQGHALFENGFAYCWSGARANVGITGGKYCFGCKVISEQPVNMEDTPFDQQHLCRVGISRGDNAVAKLGETQHSFGFGGTGKFSNSGKFSNFGTKFGVGDTIICAVNLENESSASIGFSKNGKWLGVALQFDARLCGLGERKTSMNGLEWASALFPHVMLKNVVIEMQFSLEDGLVPQEGYKPWSSSLEDGSAIVGPTFLNSKDCEVLMMVGLPGSGKTTWAESWVKEHPEKRYVLLGTNLALDQMKVPGLLRKQNYGVRFDRLMERATGIFNILLARAAKTPRNYILDQTNVYKSARKRKLKAFVEYRKIAVVVFPKAEDLKLRTEKRREEMGKEVPAEAVNEMLANYILPTSKDMQGADELFDEVIFTELNMQESQRYLREMKGSLQHTPNSDAKGNFLSCSRESSSQSFTSPPAQNRRVVSASGHSQISHSPFTTPEYGIHRGQELISPYSGANKYRKSEPSVGGYQSGHDSHGLSNYSRGSFSPSDPNLRGSYNGTSVASSEGRISGYANNLSRPISRDSPHGSYPNFCSSALPRDDPNPYDKYVGYDSSSRSSVEGRTFTAPYTDPNEGYSMYSSNYGRSSSLGRLNFENSTFSYGNPRAGLTGPRVPMAHPQTGREFLQRDTPYSAMLGLQPPMPRGSFSSAEPRYSCEYSPGSANQ